MLFMDPPDEIWFAGGELDPKTGKVKHLGGHKKDGPEFAVKKAGQLYHVLLRAAAAGRDREGRLSR